MWTFDRLSICCAENIKYVKKCFLRYDHLGRNDFLISNHSDDLVRSCFAKKLTRKDNQEKNNFYQIGYYFIIRQESERQHICMKQFTPKQCRMPANTRSTAPEIDKGRGPRASWFALVFFASRAHHELGNHLSTRLQPRAQGSRELLQISRRASDSTECLSCALDVYTGHSRSGPMRHQYC